MVDDSPGFLSPEEEYVKSTSQFVRPMDYWYEAKTAERHKEVHGLERSGYLDFATFEKPFGKGVEFGFLE